MEELKVDFYEVIQTRRSIRSFKKDPIPRKILDRVLEAAHVAPLDPIVNHGNS